MLNVEYNFEYYELLILISRYYSSCSFWQLNFIYTPRLNVPLLEYSTMKTSKKWPVRDIHLFNLLGNIHGFMYQIKSTTREKIQSQFCFFYDMLQHDPLLWVFVRLLIRRNYFCNLNHKEFNSLTSIWK